MIFPTCGKVLVVDDIIEEAMPLINLLSGKGIPTMYYSGSFSELPDTPFNSIRLVFCDLKFNAATDEKSVVSNVVGILTKLVAKENGPYLLLIWSSHETVYAEALEASLKDSGIKPEFILKASKGDYFSSRDESFDFVESLRKDIEKIELDPTDNERVMKVIEAHSSETMPLRSIANPDALQKIEEKLTEELKKANLFHLFVLWENTMGNSAIQTVNCIYNEIPNTIPIGKKLNAMLFYLSRYKLEQQLDVADVSQKLAAALASLNEMLTYFCDENVQAIQADELGFDDICKADEIKELSDARFNRWVWTSPVALSLAPGNVYSDQDKLFEYHGWLEPNIHKKETGQKTQEENEKIEQQAKEKYSEILKELHNNENIQYIFVDVSADCDYAQRKQFVSKIIPGIMLLHSDYEKYKQEKKLKGSKPNYIFLSPPIELDSKVWVVAFNLNQLCGIDINKTAEASLLFSLSRPNLTAIKQEAVSCIARQGTAAFI